MISILVFLLLALCAWHLIYEGIVAPTIRIKLRNMLFSIRDDLRRVAIDGIREQDKAAFAFLQDGINAFLNRLPGLTFDLLRRLNHEFSNNESLKGEIEEREKIISNARPEFRKIFADTNSVIKVAVIVNSGGWFVYLIPIAVAATSVSWLKRVASEMIVAPAREADRLLPAAS